MTEFVDVAGRFSIPAAELEWRFDPSGGPGGQHANRSATRVELTFDVATSASVPEELRPRLLRRLGSRARGGVVTVSVDDTRSQWRNRAIARRRLAEILADALVERRPRLPTKPSPQAAQRRLEAKRRRAEKKRLRKPPET